MILNACASLVNNITDITGSHDGPRKRFWRLGAKPQVWRGTDLFFNLIFFMETWLKAREAAGYTLVI